VDDEENLGFLLSLSVSVFVFWVRQRNVFSIKIYDNEGQNSRDTTNIATKKTDRQRIKFRIGK